MKLTKQPPEIKTYSEQTAGNAVAVVQAYTANWPYTRPLDDALLAHWHTLGERLQPSHMLIAYRDGQARAFLHGERAGEEHFINVLAMQPGAIDEGEALLQVAETQARAEGVKRLVSPCWRANAFYGGYLLGCEPYHPHWASDGIEAYVRAGFHISHPALILIRDMRQPIHAGTLPPGYTLAAAETGDEFEALPFRYIAVYDGAEAATCTARLYPRLFAPHGGAVGQLGFVGTNEAHRGKGLARILSALCLQRLADMGAVETLIATGLENYPALRAYEAVGFRRCYNINEWSKSLQGR